MVKKRFIFLKSLSPSSARARLPLKTNSTLNHNPFIYFYPFYTKAISFKYKAYKANYSKIMAVRTLIYFCSCFIIV